MIMMASVCCIVMSGTTLFAIRPTIVIYSTLFVIQSQQSTKIKQTNKEEAETHQRDRDSYIKPFISLLSTNFVNNTTVTTRSDYYYY